MIEFLWVMLGSLFACFVIVGVWLIVNTVMTRRYLR